MSARREWPDTLADPCLLSGWVFVSKADIFEKEAGCFSSGEIQCSFVCVDASFAQNATLVSKTQAEYYLLLREKKAIKYSLLFLPVHSHILSISVSGK
jgi:hypothetical protein